MTETNRNTNVTCIAETIVQIFDQDLTIEIEQSDMDLIDEGLLDSLAVVDLLVQLERRFGFTIVMDDLDLEDLRTIQRIEAFVQRNIN